MLAPKVPMLARLSLNPVAPVAPLRLVAAGAWPEAVSMDVHAGLEDLGPTWRDLAGRSIVSPYQEYDLVAGWARHAAAENGVDPRPGVVRDAGGRVVMILPFGIRHRGPVRCGGYLGGSHSNLNLPLVAQDFAAELTRERLQVILEAYCRQAGADLLALDHQPLTWNDRQHPLSALPRSASPERVPRILFSDGYDAFFSQHFSRASRHRVRTRRSALNRAGALRLWQAETPADITRILQAFAAQKAVRLAAMGVRDPFTPGVMRGFGEAAQAAAGTRDGLKLYALELDGAIMATSGGIRSGANFSWMVSSFDPAHPQSRHGPVMTLLAWSLERCCADGVTSYDFGAGDEGYKDFWANDVVELFDTVHAVTLRGRMAAQCITGRSALTRMIKGRPALFAALKAARARLRGRAAA